MPALAMPPKIARRSRGGIDKRRTTRGDLLNRASGANCEPIRSRLNKSWSRKADNNGNEMEGGLSEDDFVLAENLAKHHGPISFPAPPPRPQVDSIADLPAYFQQHLKSPPDGENHHTVTDGSSSKDIMNANGTGNHSLGRHQQPHSTPNRRSDVNASSIVHNNNSSMGPIPNHIQVAKPYVFSQAIEGCLHDLGVAHAREDNIRLAGVQWIDNVRKALKLPVRTFDTAAVYYHKFRLSHADNEYSFVDAAAAALFAACKIEDTLKKSRDILCAAHNLKLNSRAEHLSPDDSLFEPQSRATIGLERLMLEASSFDFRNRCPQHLLVKLARYYGYEKHSAITKTAYDLSLDLYRTFAPLKQSTATMAFACLELSGRLHGQEEGAIVDGRDYPRWNVERAQVMETLLDLLELYIQYRTSTTVGPDFPIDAFLEIRLSLNDELSTRRIPRYTEHIDTSQLNKGADPAGYAINSTNGVLPNSNGINGRLKTSPTSPATPGTPGQTGTSIRQKAGERGKEGTVRFMLNPDREREEKMITKEYLPLLASMRR